MQIDAKKYVYIFIRKDMSIQQQLVQASHAAHESGLNHTQSTQSHSIIALGIDNKEQLEHLYQYFSQQLECYPFYEPYKDMGLTAFATKPITEEYRGLFKQFKLWSI